MISIIQFLKDESDKRNSLWLLYSTSDPAGSVNPSALSNDLREITYDVIRKYGLGELKSILDMPVEQLMNAGLFKLMLQISRNIFQYRIGLGKSDIVYALDFAEREDPDCRQALQADEGLNMAIPLYSISDLSDLSSGCQWSMDMREKCLKASPLIYEAIKSLLGLGRLGDLTKVMRRDGQILSS